VLHIVVKPGAGVETVKEEHVQLIKQLVDEIIKFGKPQELTMCRLPGVIPVPDPSAKARFFFIRSITVEKLQTSVQQGVWATNRANTQVLTEAYEACDHVILLFCAEDSLHFQGCARMESLPDPLLLPGFGGQKTIGETFTVKWVKQCMLPFSKLASLRNTMNNNLPLQKCEDGQELQEHAGEACMRLMQQQNAEDFLTLPTDIEAPFDILFSCRSTRVPSPQKESPKKRSQSQQVQVEEQTEECVAQAFTISQALEKPPPAKPHQDAT
jgi:hypothetical protein